MAKLTDDEQAYLDSLKALAGDDPAALGALKVFTQARIGAPEPLDQSVAVPPAKDTKPSGWFWRRFRR